MKRFLLLPLIFISLFACNKKDDSNTPEPPVTRQDSLVVLTYDTTEKTVTATPGDSVVTYVLQIWLVEDYILDYGDDFTDEGVKNALSSYLDMCIQWQMIFPTFDAPETTLVFDWFDQMYLGKEYIAMAASYDEQARKINGPVSFIRFYIPDN